MGDKETKSRFLNTATLKIAGVLLTLLAAVTLLWQVNKTSSQAEMAMLAQVYFDGEYRIADGEWQEIVEGEHISSTKGDVTLRGNFHLKLPDGEYIGLYDGGMPIAFYCNHINLTIYDGENEPYMSDLEDPIYGDSACGIDWMVRTLSGGSDEPIEILIHNPHTYGNDTAIDELLSNTAFWTNLEFQKAELAKGETQRDIGILFMMISLLLLGCALFSTLIRIKNSKILWILGAVILFAGAYLTYSTDGISFWSDSIVSNTTILGCSMMFYMLFISMALVHFLKDTRKAGILTVTALGAVNIVFLIIPTVSDMLFYDTWVYWTAIQILASIAMAGCLVKEFIATKGKTRWLYLGSILPFVAFCFDAVMIGLGFWNTGFASIHNFAIFFIIAMIAVLKIIPHSIIAVAKAKELESERIALNSKLTESRVSTMMSQIRPHFIYNTLGSIEQLCSLDPPKAGELVHNFAKYLRGNFGELDNPKPILMSQEMEHVHYYVSIENVRFPDMTFSFEMDSVDFHIPALTIQPIVENAIKHGLMKLPRGGTIRVISHETPTHYCVTVEDNGAGFDTGILLDERKHVGIRNIRGRLEAMVNGTLEIESTEGIGTKVTIKIPKEVNK